MSFHKAVDAYHEFCCYNSKVTVGSAGQIAICTAYDCKLLHLRSVTATQIPIKLLNAHRIAPEKLCDRARVVARSNLIAAEAGHMVPLLASESSFGGLS